ncbi:MAG: ACT domain-containing protein, partial [Deinococcus sp.]|nr:ACT domain-containing protein [Deinococcus sp.]
GAALDVFEQEPPWDSPLLELEQCVFTAHLGGSTAEAQERAAQEIVKGVVDVLKGRAVRAAVNLPPLDADGLKVLGPYLTLAEKLGKLLSQLVKGRATELAVEYSGEFPREPRILGIAALKGLLDPILNEALSFVAAPAVAKERGIRVTESVAPQPRDYLNLLTLVVRADGQTRVASGTTFGGEPRIVHLDGYRVDAVPAGHMFILKNVDVPGVIGHIATLLGENRINIAQVTWGRDRPGGTAMTAINVDQPPPQGLVDQIKALPYVLSAEQVAL